MRTLLLDQSPDFRSIIADSLNEFFGAVSIEPAASGGEALAAIERRCPELVLASHAAPLPNGIEFARAVKGRGVKARPNAPAKAWAEGVAARAMTARPRQRALAGVHRARRAMSSQALFSHQPTGDQS